MARQILFLAIVALSASAQRPCDTSICDYYSNNVLGSTNATAEKTLVTKLVNAALIGIYTTPMQVAGILANNATFNGTKVDLTPYFNGDKKTTNTGKKHGVSVNWLDGGGAEPLKEGKAAKDSHSNQLFV
jgi:hypothetical protein